MHQCTQVEPTIGALVLARTHDGSRIVKGKLVAIRDQSAEIQLGNGTIVAASTPCVCCPEYDAEARADLWSAYLSITSVPLVLQTPAPFYIVY